MKFNIKGLLIFMCIFMQFYFDKIYNLCSIADRFITDVVGELKNFSLN